MDKTVKIYIAGHRGLVGSAIVRKLQADRYINLVLKSRKELELTDANEVKRFFNSEKPECVILAAARVGGIAANISYPTEFLIENLQIQNNVIGISLEYKVKKFLFLGSSCVYPRDCPQPMKEEYFMTGKPEPTNEPYAVAKITGMKLCEYIYEEHGKKYISCIPTNIYGENDNFDPEFSHVIPALMRRMHEAKINNQPEVIIWGSGNSRREFLHSNDLADAIVFLMKNYNEKQFINVGTGEDISIKELARLIQKVVGYRGKLVFDTTKPDGMPKKLLDVSRLHSLGWHHKIILQDGLTETYKWYVK